MASHWLNLGSNLYLSLVVAQGCVLLTVFFYFKRLHSRTVEDARAKGKIEAETKVNQVIHELEKYKFNLATKQKQEINKAVESGTLALQTRVSMLERKLLKYRSKHSHGKSKARQLMRVYEQRQRRLSSLVAIQDLDAEEAAKTGVGGGPVLERDGKKSDRDAESDTSGNVGSDFDATIQAELKRCEDVERLLMNDIEAPSGSGARGEGQKVSVRAPPPHVRIKVPRRKLEEPFTKIYGAGRLPMTSEISATPKWVKFGQLREKDVVQIACSIDGENILCLSSEEELYWWAGEDNAETMFEAHKENQKTSPKALSADVTATIDDARTLERSLRRKGPKLVKTMVLEKALHNRHIISIACGPEHCAIVCQSGEVFTWGVAQDGRLGLKIDDGYVDKPQLVVSLAKKQVIQVECGGAHTVARTSLEVLYTFGRGRCGRLGHGDEKDQRLPKLVSAFKGNVLGKRVETVACGWGHTVALDAEGNVHSFGRGDNGQLGHGTETNEYSPRRIDSDNMVSWKAVRVACGYYHTLVLTRSRDMRSNEVAVFSWGLGQHGELGTGDVHLTVPKRVLFPFNILGKAGGSTGNGGDADVELVHVACGAFHNIALAKTGAVYVWGMNEDGNLGTGTVKDVLRPREMNWISKYENHKVVSGVCSSRFTLLLCEQCRNQDSASGLALGTNAPSESNLDEGEMLLYGDGLEDADEEISTTLSTSAKELERNTRVWSQILLPKWEVNTGDLDMEKLRKYIYRGVPPELRGRVWRLAIGNHLRITPELFQVLKRSQQNTRTRSSALDNDLPRTFSELALFGEQGAFHKVLKDVLETYIAYRPDIGYVQGMSYVSAMLCLYTPDSFTAFCCLGNIIVSEHFFPFFALDVEKISQYYSIFEMALQSTSKRIGKLLVDLKIEPELYIFSWFQTVFVRVLPLRVASRVWDCFLVDGTIVLFRVALALILLLKPKLKQCETFEECYALLMQKGEESKSTWNSTVTEKALFKKLQTVILPRQLTLKIQLLKK